MKRPQTIATFCIDIGGTGTKGLIADQHGQAASDRVRLPTPRPATPDAVLAAIRTIVERLPPFSRVAAGFPGVVVEGVVHTAPNLHPSWSGFPLAEALEELTGQPARVANDAGVQGLAVIEGRGTELVLTLGTGMGFALYVDGRYVPNVEMAHHPFSKRKSYEELVGNEALARAGRKRWNRRLRKVIEQLEPIFNYRVLYLGGGNAKLIHFALPPNVHIVENVAGLLGGVKLWAQPVSAPAGHATAD
ncbi:MAG TPA: ROK family protein [Thermoanaerobaculia bacterium]|nr:ROK family protein [Thermoanaerobaculia bacterium]